MQPSTPQAKYRFLETVDLASERVGGKALVANDEFFAAKSNLLKAGRGISIPDKYTERGKWMDGWETRRRRTPGYDWCIISILPGDIHGVVVDTNHFLGNYPESCSLDWAEIKGSTPAKNFNWDKVEWRGLIAKSPLQGGSEHFFEASPTSRATHVRLNIFPDGGVSRLRIYGIARPQFKESQKKTPFDLALITHGGRVIVCNDMFFGPKDNLIMPGRAKNMGDGWETKRKRTPGYDWLITKLAGPGIIRKIEVDTNFFKGNFPESCSIEGVNFPAGDWKEDFSAERAWQELLPRTKLKAHYRHFFQKELKNIGTVTHLRLNIFPDGGISRLRAFGVLA